MNFNIMIIYNMANRQSANHIMRHGFQMGATPANVQVAYQEKRRRELLDGGQKAIKGAGAALLIGLLMFYYGEDNSYKGLSNEDRLYYNALTGPCIPGRGMTANVPCPTQDIKNAAQKILDEDVKLRSKAYRNKLNDLNNAQKRINRLKSKANTNRAQYGKRFNTKGKTYRSKGRGMRKTRNRKNKSNKRKYRH